MDVIGEGDQVNECVGDFSENLDDQDNQENPVEVAKLAEIQRIEDEFAAKISVDKKQSKNQIGRPKSELYIQNSLEEIEVKIGKLVESAEEFANFLLHRHRQIEKHKHEGKHSVHREFAEQQDDDNKQSSQPTFLMDQPSILQGGLLKGLNWMISLYETGINGILADEMGLGKTIQTISLIAFLKQFKKIQRPFLIIAPLSTLGNWMNEFKKWLPHCRVVKLIARMEVRGDIIKNFINSGNFDVIVTSFSGVQICLTELKRFMYRYIIVDEAHQLKNETTQLCLAIRNLNSCYKLLLTGTPLQNNPHELWSLLNLIMPKLFSSSEVFDKWFEANQLQANSKLQICQEDLDQKNKSMIDKMQKVLRVFMLRRTKTEVEKFLPPKKEIHLFVQMTLQQKEMYRNLLLTNQIMEGNSKGQLMNKLMQLRKICLHPYTFPNVEDLTLPPLGEHLITASGKMIVREEMVLDKLLKKLYSENHQVLIFSQFKIMLNIIEDYCTYRNYLYKRIDGDTELEDRDQAIQEFTDPDSNFFIFLLSTRAGGLGINLATADTVIIYDSDFNPQVDLQAMDRAHRIGQKNPVMVYRLAVQYTVEEKIIERQSIKLQWDHYIIQHGLGQGKNHALQKKELQETLIYGAQQIFSINDFTDEGIDEILKRGEQLTNQMNQQIENKLKQVEKQASLSLGVQTINMFSYFTENELDYEQNQKAIQKQEFIQQNRMKSNAHLNAPSKIYFKHMKQTVEVPFWHLYQSIEQYQELFQQSQDFKLYESVKDQVENIIDPPQPLTDNEQQLLNKLESTAFTNWSKYQFEQFKSACEKYGHENYDQIEQVLNGEKSKKEIQQYSNAFWSRAYSIPQLYSLKEKIQRRNTNKIII